MLALVASIHVLNTALPKGNVDGRDKPDHDGKLRRGMTLPSNRRA
jgi:hypothetical protein